MNRTSSDFSVSRLRKLNSYEACGLHQRDLRPLDEIILDHLQLVRDMARLNRYEETICRMLVEGYTRREIAVELNLSARTTCRMVSQIRWSLFGVDAHDALTKKD